MVRIVTGKIDSGKTTRLEGIHAEKGGDGFVAIKRMEAGKVEGYLAKRLSTGETFPLSAHGENADIDFAVAFAIGPYRFSALAVKRIDEVMRSLLKEGVEPLYLDEVGFLELQGGGFDGLVKEMVASGREIYLTVRDSLVREVERHYGLENAEILRG